jgi:hypothetical protein
MNGMGVCLRVQLSSPHMTRHVCAGPETRTRALAAARRRDLGWQRRGEAEGGEAPSSTRVPQSPDFDVPGISRFRRLPKSSDLDVSRNLPISTFPKSPDLDVSRNLPISTSPEIFRFRRLPTLSDVSRTRMRGAPSGRRKLQASDFKHHGMFPNADAVIASQPAFIIIMRMKRVGLFFAIPCFLRCGESRHVAHGSRL